MEVRQWYQHRTAPTRARRSPSIQDRSRSYFNIILSIYFQAETSTGWTFANEVRRRENLNRAAAVRMRLALMTTAAMAAGLIALLFASGAGAASRFAIGVVVVMGMLAAALFTLFVPPTVYSLIAKNHR